ncbi:MAG: lipocalin-like domain-containing protein [Vicinamibacterales bacterium]
MPSASSSPRRRDGTRRADADDGGPQLERRTAPPVDERRGVVVHTVTGSSFPHWVGTDQVRYSTLSSDGRTLELSLKDGDRVTQTLAWRKVE